MARTVGIFLGVWVVISIPTGIVLGRLGAAASRLPGPPKLWTPERQRWAARSREQVPTSPRSGYDAAPWANDLPPLPANGSPTSRRPSPRSSKMPPMPASPAV
jgi:hypothetical protein